MSETQSSEASDNFALKILNKKHEKNIINPLEPS